jgi:hypothetical protein
VIPLYNLQAAQRRMRAAFPDIHEDYMSPPAFCRIADACKLFDYDARRWTDFEGRPTGPVLIAHADASDAFEPSESRSKSPSAKRPHLDDSGSGVIADLADLATVRRDNTPLAR